METLSIGNLTLFYDAAEKETAELVRQASEKSVQLINECWGLNTPKGCRVYVMTSWLAFVFHSAPWPRRIVLGAFMPLWAFRARKIWKYSGGWTLPYKRPAVGIKPAWLVQQGDSSIGARIFVQEDDLDEKVRHITCHELTHAFTAHLKLPVWLSEGLAMVAVDKFFGRPTVQDSTIGSLGRSPGQASPRGYRRLSAEDPDAFIYPFIRGYWITRYLEETQAGLLESVLAQRHSHETLETKVATARGMGREEFWQRVDLIVTAHFRERGSNLEK